MNPELKAAWDAARDKLLYPPSSSRSHPYYIAAPRWTHSSAGIRALYLLCHALNRAGFEAYISHHANGRFSPPWTNPELRAPMLQEFHLREHLAEKLTPVVVYPETVRGNPLRAKVVVRWVMYYPGVLGGDREFPSTDICFGYSRELAHAVGHPEHVLQLPTVDTRLFHPPAGAEPRDGGCFFAAKYQKYHGGKLFPITADCKEITRQRPDSPTPAEVADLLRRSDTFYAYENTALAIEAVLCGCPAVFLPNPDLTEVIGQDHLGPEGYAWGAGPAEVARARASVAQGAINYLKTYDVFHEQLKSFVAITQTRAAATNFDATLACDSWPYQPQPSWPVRTGRKLARSLKKRFGKAAEKAPRP